MTAMHLGELKEEESRPLSSMGSWYLDPGIYTNVFPVRIPDVTVTVMTASAKAFPSLQDLREQIHASSLKIRVYRLGDVVFGYGSNLDWFFDKGFEEQQKRLFDYPKWCARMIVEGLTDHLKAQGYREWTGKGRITLYESKPFGQAAQGQIQVFRGYDLRAIYWKRDNRLLFGLIVDICWEIQDAYGNRLSPQKIAQYNAMAEIAQIQEEFLPGNHINLEVSRLRLQNHILPFVQNNKTFDLPCGENIKATLNEVPVRVILGG